MKKKKRMVFAALRKSDNKLILSPCKTIIADFLGICSKTVYRHLMNKSMYSCNKYITWKDVPVPKKKTGFAL